MAETKGEGCFKLGKLLSAQFITQLEACHLLLCSPYFRKDYDYNKAGHERKQHADISPGADPGFFKRGGAQIKA